MHRLWREAPYLTAGLVLTLAVAAFFAVRLAMGALFWADPRHQDMPIAPWMTPRFVAMSWDVPATVVIGALGILPDRQGPKPLKQLAAERAVPVNTLIADLETAIVAYRQAQNGTAAGIAADE